MTDTVDIGQFICGEIPDPIEYQFEDSKGNPLDLTGFTVTFHYAERDGIEVNVPAAVSNAASGKVTYTWTGMEFLTPGSYSAIFWVDDNALKYSSWVIKWRASTGIPTGSISGSYPQGGSFLTVVDGGTA